MLGAVIVAQTGEWYFYLAPGSKGRVVALTVGSEPVVVFYQAPASAYDEFAQIAEAIVASLVFSE